MSPMPKQEKVEPFIQATIDTFKTMAHLDVDRGEIKPMDLQDTCQDVSGAIELSGMAEGSVTLGLPKLTAMAVACSFLRASGVSKQLMADAIGELVNIIAGHAKKDIPDLDIEISLPKVVIGEKHEISSHSDARKLVVFFDSPVGKFHLVVHLDRQFGDSGLDPVLLEEMW
ncbi:MAG TPA: chemotaxis protein CheX [Fibrobacteria bacterium]|nr:chemotaxis protein CheX [Fibrobacteria bacterium]